MDTFRMLALGAALVALGGAVVSLLRGNWPGRRGGGDAAGMSRGEGWWPLGNSNCDGHGGHGSDTGSHGGGDGGGGDGGPGGD